MLYWENQHYEKKKTRKVLYAKWKTVIILPVSKKPKHDHYNHVKAS